MSDLRRMNATKEQKWKDDFIREFEREAAPVREANLLALLNMERTLRAMNAASTGAGVGMGHAQGGLDHEI